jgi:hypothetical protein
MFKKIHFLPAYFLVFAAPLYAEENIQKLDDMTVVSAPFVESVDDSAHPIRIGNSTASTEVSHLKPLSPAPFFTLSALTERLPRSSDPIVNQKSALCGPIHNLKIHRHKPAQGESKTLTQLYPFTL